MSRYIGSRGQLIFDTKEIISLLHKLGIKTADSWYINIIDISYFLDRMDAS